MSRRSTHGHRDRTRRHTGHNGSALTDGIAALREQAASQASSLWRRAKAGGEELLNVRRVVASRGPARVQARRSLARVGE